jgi:hypothetical protein
MRETITTVEDYACSGYLTYHLYKLNPQRGKWFVNDGGHLEMPPNYHHVGETNGRYSIGESISEEDKASAVDHLQWSIGKIKLD